MHSLTKSYNRRFYRNIIKLKINMYWKLFKLELIHFLIWLTYKIDADLSKRIIGKRYR